MSNTIPSLLNDTLNLVSLARESALSTGKNSQAEKLSPVVDELRSAVLVAKNPSGISSADNSTSTTKISDSTTTSTQEITPTGTMAQSDFQTLLNTAQNTTPSERSIPTLDISERNSVVKAMADGNMSDVDIARQLGMTRDEVQLVINIGKATSATTEVSK
jgi:hypothetical protein